MQTIDKQSSEYANSNFQHCTYHYTDDKRLTDYDSIKDAFKAGGNYVKDVLIEEIERRQKLIISEPDGIVRETMISDLLVGLQCTLTCCSYEQVCVAPRFKLKKTCPQTCL